MKTIAKNIAHHIDFEATPRKNEYIINTHTRNENGKITQATYLKKNTDENYFLVNHIASAGADLSTYGFTWLIEKIPCGNAECPYTVRAAEDQTRGRKEKL